MKLNLFMLCSVLALFIVGCATPQASLDSQDQQDVQNEPEVEKISDDLNEVPDIDAELEEADLEDLDLDIDY